MDDLDLLALYNYELLNHAAELVKPKQPKSRFNLDKITDEDSLFEFRFTKEDIER